MDKKDEMERDETPQEIEFGKELDLHMFHPRDTALVIRAFIENALEKEYPLVKIIHGRGKSVRKREVYNILTECPCVAGVRDDGANWGASLVELRAP